MPEQDLTVSFNLNAENIGDLEEHTISLDTAREIADLVREDVVDRYEHLTADHEINIVQVDSPNTVRLHVKDPDE